jgi:hypothetical protein
MVQRQRCRAVNNRFLQSTDKFLKRKRGAYASTQFGAAPHGPNTYNRSVRCTYRATTYPWPKSPRYLECLNPPSARRLPAEVRRNNFSVCKNSQTAGAVAGGQSGHTCDDLLAFLLLRHTGLRGSDAVQLTWAEIYFDRREIERVTQKRRKLVVLPIQNTSAATHSRTSACC